MRPKISSLVKGLYENLKDDETVKVLPSVAGLADNVFFLDHRHPEGGFQGESEAQRMSYYNIWEVQMTYALVRHLIQQDEYGSNDIAVLTPYNGQLQRLQQIFALDSELYVADFKNDQQMKSKNSPENLKNNINGKNVSTLRKKLSDLVR